MVTITLAQLDGEDMRLKIDPPDADGGLVGGMLFTAILGAAVNCGVPRETLAEHMRKYADELEASTDEEYHAAVCSGGVLIFST
jgi:hypothetical protein